VTWAQHFQNRKESINLNALFRNRSSHHFWVADVLSNKQQVV
jgi:hypothetical protein